MKKLLTILAMSIIAHLHISTLALAQESWTLKKCIQHALENNLQIKQNDLNIALSESFLKQSKAVKFPSLNANASHSYNFGRSIDPTTNDFVSQTIQSNGFSLNTNLILFNGFQRSNIIKRNKLNVEAEKYDVEQKQNNIKLQVLTAYLQILFDKEDLQISKNQFEVTQQQVERTKALFNAGVLTEGDLLDIQAQLANEELQIVDATNRLELSYLDIKQLLDIDLAQPFSIAQPEIDMTLADQIDSVNFDDIFQTVAQSYPGLKSSNLRLLSSQKDISIAKGRMSPSVSFSGNVNTNFSNIRQRIVDLQFAGYQTIGYLSTDLTTTVVAENYDIIYENTPFVDQLDENLSQAAGFNLSMPIFNGWQTKQAINRAKIDFLNAEYTNELTKNRLQKEVQQAITNVKAAEKKYVASLKNQKASERSFQYAQERYNQKVINTMDFVDAKNRFSKASSNLIQAKYDYIFKVKILDFYQGKELVF